MSLRIHKCNANCLTHRTPPLAHGYKNDSSYVMTASGNAQRTGITAKPINAYRLPAAFNDGSTPNGPPIRNNVKGKDKGSSLLCDDMN